MSVKHEFNFLAGGFFFYQTNTKKNKKAEPD